MQCARHPKEETGLSCGKCGTPICSRCTVYGPVGTRCRDCASLRSSVLYQVRPERFALASVLGLTAGVIVGVLLQFLAGIIYFLLFVGPAIGGAMGELILRASGRKRGLKLEILAGVSVVGGAIISQVAFGGWHLLRHSPLHLILYLVAVGLTTAAAVGRLRYS